MAGSGEVTREPTPVRSWTAWSPALPKVPVVYVAELLQACLRSLSDEGIAPERSLTA